MNLDRRAFLRYAGCAGASMALRSNAATRPNVIFLLTDDQGYGDLACHGNPAIKTPHLDALHQRSLRFTDFHVSPTCAPTRASLMTGRYSNATGVWHTIMGRSLLHPQEVTMADCFKASGYRTGIFGKWHLGDNYPCRPQDRGFDEALVCGGGGVWQTPDYFGNDYTNDTYLHNGQPEKATGYCTDVWFDKAMRFMEESGGQPFFCYLPTNAPHMPMWAPDSYTKPYEGVNNLPDPGFYGMITNIDDNVGRLVQFLRERGLEENTIFIFMTDNGTAAGAEVFNAGMRGAKGSAYEGGHRVPFFLYWPAGGIKGGRDIGALSAHIDVLPTLLDLCSLKKPQGPTLHGKSLVPLLHGRGETERMIVVDSQRQEHLVLWRQAAVMAGPWRLVDECELYDLRRDPGQTHDVAADHADIVARLTAEYGKWWELTSQRADGYVRIVLGNKAAKTVKLSAHDWHGNGAEAVWNQQQIRQGPAANGFWTVDVARTGEYRLELRRWPRESDTAINASYRELRPNREHTPGRSISVTRARVKLGLVDLTAAVGPEEKAAVFTARLAQGPAELQTFFYGARGEERGAYYVYVERSL